jgi:DNA-binding MarR family transcriptional regulator
MSDAHRQAVEALRAFNRFHTRFSGVLDSSFMGSGLSLTEARILFEIANGQPVLAAEVQTELGLDRGYLSRLIGRFEQRGWIERGRGEDARQRPIALTEAGRTFFDSLDRRTYDHVSASIGHLDAGERRALVEALSAVTQLLSKGGEQG